MSVKKRKTELSVSIVEDHNDVLYHIYRAIGSKKIPFEQGCMIHFDSHPDMMIPKSLDTSKIFEKEHVLNALSIENWIMPAIYAGHFSTVAWIKPVWATQLENGIHNFKIGIDKISKEIKVTCSQSYFVSELAWSPEEGLENVRNVTLEVCTLGEPQEGSSTEGASPKPSGDTLAATGETHTILNVCNLSQEVREKVASVPYVLDIDLDFFSTRNPFWSLFTEQQFSHLRQLYHYEHPEDTTEEALLEATSKRREQLSELESIFNSVKEGVPPKQSPRLAAVQPLLATFPDGRPPDPGLLNDAGCTCDDCDLPHHVSSRDHIRHLVVVAKEFLSSLPKPALITIARSSRDDYCPPEDVDFIQDAVIDMLKHVYGSINVHSYYEEKSQETAQGTSS